MDKDEILNTLQIISLSKDWPNLRAIHDVAMGELFDANEEAKKTLAKWAEEEKAELAAAEAERARLAKRAAIEADRSVQKPVVMPQHQRPVIERLARDQDEPERRL